MSEPLISVIIPTYNCEAYIVQAIDSVLAQTWKNFEILVVDDGSTDETGVLVSQFKDRRVRYILRENGGHAAARNTAIRASCGKYLAFLDADDLFLPHKLELQFEALEANPSCALVSSGWLTMDRNGNMLQEVKPWETFPSMDCDALLSGCPFLLQSVLVRRNVIERVGLFDAGLIGWEDWDLLLRMVAAGYRMEWLREVVCKYRIHPGNNSRDPRRQKEIIRVLDRFFGGSFSSKVSDELKERAYTNALLLVAGSLYMAGLFEKGKETLTQAVEKTPTLVQGDPPPLATTIRNWALDPRVLQPAQYASQVFDNLPESTIRLQRYRKRVLAAVHIDRAFFNHASHNSRAALGEVLQGALSNPSWIHNRGVWAIAAKSLVGMLRSA